MSKSHVTIEQKMCPITGNVWETGELLFDKKMRNKFENNTITGYAFSPEAQEQLDKGFVALVEVNEEKSKNTNGKAKMEDAHRTGRLCYLKREVATELFGNQIQDMNFLVEDQFERLVKINENLNKENDITEEESAAKNGKS